MAIKADFTHYHGMVYPETYIRLTKPIGEKTEWSAIFDIYPSQEAWETQPTVVSLETLSVDFTYDYAGNLYELAYNALKAQYADRLDNITDI